MIGERRARDRPRALFYFILEVFMNVRQLELFHHEITIRSWCGHHWLVLVWRLWDGTHLGEYLIERVG